MMRIGATANITKPRAADILRRLAVRAAGAKLDLVVCDETARLLPGIPSIPRADLAAAVDVLVALGGDGTMLRAARMLYGHDIPLLGVNLGSLGFLTSVPDDRIEDAIDRLAGGDCTVSLRSAIEAVLVHEGCAGPPCRALNDMAIGWGESSRVVTLGLSIDGVAVGAFVCDGLIVSTPTGSTGHSLSAGGPIVHPESDVLVLNPICPHTLSHRPMVIPGDRRIVVDVIGSSKKQIFVVDGQDNHSIEQGDRVEIVRSPRGIRFLHLPGANYFDVLRQKLHWRGSAA